MKFKLSINQEYVVDADDEIDAKIEVLESLLATGGYDFIVTTVGS